MRLGDYVTAKLVNGENGEVRQGVFAYEHPDGTIRVEGSSGDDYHCYADASVVHHLLDEETLQFALTRQRQLRPFEEGE
jgi:hypothetical protein